MSSKAAVYRGDKTFSIEQKSVSAPAAGEVQIDVANRLPNMMTRCGMR